MVSKTGHSRSLFNIFFPIGIFLMWKYDLWNITSRVLVSVFFGLFVISKMSDNSNSSKSESIPTPFANQKICSESRHIEYVREHFERSGNSVHGINTAVINSCGYVFLVNGYNQSKGWSYTCTVKTNGNDGIQIIDAGCDYK